MADALSRFPSEGGEVFLICEGHRSDTVLQSVQKQQRNVEDIVRSSLLTHVIGTESLVKHVKDTTWLMGVLYFETAREEAVGRATTPATAGAQRKP